MKQITFLSLAILAGLSLSTVAEARGQDHGPRPAFEEVDADGNGEVTPAELRGMGDARKAARFDDADADDDGFLTQAELDAAHEARQASRSARMIERLDTDGDGQLSREEAQARGERGGEGRGEGRGRGGRGFERADADGSGTLNAAEWETLGQRRARN